MVRVPCHHSSSAANSAPRAQVPAQQTQGPAAKKPKAKPWTPDHEPPSITFINANLVDTKLGKLHHDVTITSSGGIISSVELTGAGNYPRDNSHVVDLKGKYLMPGLIDCHVHLLAIPGTFSLASMYNVSPSTIALRSTWTARSMLLRGFTTARDTGGADDSLKNAIAEFLVPGPRLFTCGKAMSQTGGHMDSREPWEGFRDLCCGGHSEGLGVAVDGVDGCLRQARENLRRGANFLKIASGGGVASIQDPLEMVQFTAEEIRAVVSAADALGTYVTAHTYTSKGIRHAVDNGVKGIEHANFVDRETAKYLKERDVSVTPTLVTYQAMADMPDFLDEKGLIKNKQVLASGLKALRVLYDEGVNVCFGTDLLAWMQQSQRLVDSSVYVNII